MQVTSTQCISPPPSSGTDCDYQEPDFSATQHTGELLCPDLKHTCTDSTTPERWEITGTYHSEAECQLHIDSNKKNHQYGVGHLGKEVTAVADTSHRGRALNIMGGARQKWGSAGLHAGKDEKALRNMGLMSFLSYADDPSYINSVKAWTCAVCQKLPQHVVSAVFNAKKVGGVDWHLQAVVIYDQAEHLHIVTYRGTIESDWQNILIDLMIAPVPFQGGKAHLGFLKSFQLLDAQVRGFLLQHPTADIAITGHSFGAALATIAGLVYGADDSVGSVKTVVTFGCPRVISTNLAKNYETLSKGAKVHRIVHRLDIIPRSLSTVFGYRHPADEVWYGNEYTSNAAQYCDGSGEDPNCSDKYGYKQIANCAVKAIEFAAKQVLTLGLDYLLHGGLKCPDKCGLADHSLKDGYLTSIPILDVEEPYFLTMHACGHGMRLDGNCCTDTDCNHVVKTCKWYEHLWCKSSDTCTPNHGCDCSSQCKAEMQHEDALETSQLERYNAKYSRRLAEGDDEDTASTTSKKPKNVHTLSSIDVSARIPDTTRLEGFRRKPMTWRQNTTTPEEQAAKEEQARTEGIGLVVSVLVVVALVGVVLVLVVKQVRHGGRGEQVEQVATGSDPKGGVEIVDVRNPSFGSAVELEAVNL